MPDDTSGESIKQETIQQTPEIETTQSPSTPDYPPTPPAQTVSENRMEAAVHAIDNRVSRAEWLMIGLTAGIVLLTLGLVIVGTLQWRVMSGQLGEMKSGGADTKILAIAAGKQTTETHELAIAAGKQADASKALAELAARQLVASQRLIESQRASISVAFMSTLNPITFHEGGLSFAFSIVLRNEGQLPATRAAVKFTTYFETWGSSMFDGPQKHQVEYCSKPPEIVTDESSDRRFTLFHGDARESQINFGTQKPSATELVDMPGDPTNSKRVFPFIVGCVDYKSGALPENHQTGFIFAIQRVSVLSPGLSTLINFNQDVPKESVIVTQHFFGQGRSY